MALALASLAWSIDASLSARRLARLVTIVGTVHRLRADGLACAAPAGRGAPGAHADAAGLAGVRPRCSPRWRSTTKSPPSCIGAWRGLANHKNGLGALACFGLIFWCHGWLSGEVRTPAALFGIGVSAACLVLSRSSTSMAATVFVVLFLAVALRGPVALRRWLPTGRGAADGAAAALCAGHPRPDPRAGHAAGLAGRPHRQGHHAHRPHRDLVRSSPSTSSCGPSSARATRAYWTAGPMLGTESHEFVRRMQGFYPGSAHNGYLEIANDLGWVGLAGLLGYTVDARAPVAAAAAPGALAGACCIWRCSFSRRSPTCRSRTGSACSACDFVIMTLASTALARSLLEHRLRGAVRRSGSARAWRAGTRMSATWQATTPNSESMRTATIPGLDGIRALAVALVFFAHSGLENVIPGGLGVTVFFVLSGYLITTLMRQRTRAHRRARLSRLLPAALLAVDAAAGVSWSCSPALLAALGVIDGAFSLGRLVRGAVLLGNYFVIAQRLPRPARRCRRGVVAGHRGALLPLLSAAGRRCCCARAAPASRQRCCWRCARWCSPGGLAGVAGHVGRRTSPWPPIRASMRSWSAA